MSFNESIGRVKRAELKLDANAGLVSDHWQQLRQTWRDAWTPGRIVFAGIASGFVVGLGEVPKATGSGFIHLFSAISGLMARERATEAASAAEDAADAAQPVVPVAPDMVARANLRDDESESIRTHEALRRSGAL